MTLPAASPSDRPSARRGQLPTRAKLLFVTTLARRVGWLEAAFAAEGEGEVELTEALGGTAGLAQLRDDVFDAVLIQHDPPTLDAVKLVGGLRAGGFADPVVIIGNGECFAECHEAGADGYCDITRGTTRSLLWACSQALDWHALVQENWRLRQQEFQRCHSEHEAAERLLEQQRALVAALPAAMPGTVGPPSAAWSDALENRYRELLRAYVMMGSGNLVEERRRLVALLVAEGLTVPQAIALHTGVLEGFVRELGNRSTRYVLNRADLLALEIVAHLAEEHRLRWHDHAIAG